MFDRAEIMKSAWAIVRRFFGNGEPFRALMSRALKFAWEKARERVSVAQAVEHKVRANEALASRSADDLQREITGLENKDHWQQLDHARMSALRAALQVAQSRETSSDEYTAKRDLIASSGGRFCSVTFIKADGSERTMQVQPAALRHHVKGDAASEAAKRATQTRKARHPHLLPVWDAKASAPRSVNLATITRIAIDGAIHEYRA
ncbi:hypothetical protein ACM25N_11035 [Roseovarius sp. C7]|uniref:hypothetical protein n=1 Tax=Roseovarius sp. C7 TaxID=3398643 RepID=UPI0039F6ABE6